jgi:hypothetical protein
MLSRMRSLRCETRSVVTRVCTIAVDQFYPAEKAYIPFPLAFSLVRSLGLRAGGLVIPVGGSGGVRVSTTTVGRSPLAKIAFWDPGATRVTVSVTVVVNRRGMTTAMACRKCTSTRGKAVGPS